MSRLLIIDPGVELWGSEKALLATLPVLQEQNDALLLVIPKGAGLKAPAQDIGVPTREADIGLLHEKSRLARLKGVAHLIRVAVKFRPDTIYVNQAGFCRIGHLVARICRARLVAHIRIKDDIKRCANLVASQSAPIDLIHISHAMRELYVEQKPSHKRHFMAYDLFQPSPRENVGDVSNAREKVTKFICVGRIAGLKGQLELVYAFAEFAKSNKSAVLDIVGAATQEPAYGNEVESAIVEQGMESRIRLLGYRDDVEELMRGSDVLVSPSYFESLGRTLMEGWDAGCVCIAQKGSGGAEEIAVLSGGGIVYDGTESDGLAQALHAASQLSASKRQAMIKSAAIWMDDNLSMIQYRKSLAGCLFAENID